MHALNAEKEKVLDLLEQSDVQGIRRLIRETGNEELLNFAKVALWLKHPRQDLNPKLLFRRER